MINTQVTALAEKFGISKTMAKLMIRNGCLTPDDYRQIRKRKKAEAPKKAVSEKPSKPTPQKGKKK